MKKDAIGPLAKENNKEGATNEANNLCDLGLDCVGSRQWPEAKYPAVPTRRFFGDGGDSSRTGRQNGGARGAEIPGGPLLAEDPEWLDIWMGVQRCRR